MKDTGKTKCFIEQESECNFAKIDFKNNEIKMGKVVLSDKRLDRIAFVLAHDLITIAPLISGKENLTANEVYSLLENQ